MTTIEGQVHGKFRMFLGELDEERKPTAVLKEVESFVAKNGVAPKSIGVEYLEGERKAVVTLGYRDDEPGYRVKLAVKSLGLCQDLGPSGLAALEKKLGKAAASRKGIICHELYVTEESEFLVIFMTTR